jgi:glyceraldehyde-3-phosphate dehydrogenase/erythrose-4-phosphate dehydrogenase
LGRIGRATLKIVLDTSGSNLIAANDIGPAESVEYLLRYDTVYGRYEKTDRSILRRRDTRHFARCRKRVLRLRAGAMSHVGYLSESIEQLEADD